MTSKEVFKDRSSNEKSRINKLKQNAKDIIDFLIGFRNAIIVIIIWILVGEMAGHHILDILRSILRLILYPLGLVLFNTGFDEINVPEVFFLLIPLVVLMIVGFLIIISTED